MVAAMSDFFYSRNAMSPRRVQSAFASIGMMDASAIEYREGAWGSLAVSRSLYGGYQVYEDTQYICVVIGGPVLYFCANDFMVCPDSNVGTKAILERWRQGNMRWDEDLNGPFVVLIVNKLQRQIVCVTDLMMFIPVYEYRQEQDVLLGTHVDALAELCNQRRNPDIASQVDFILHGIVTYPYTIYTALRQCQPAAEYRLTLDGKKGVETELNIYWQPEEKYRFASLAEAANELREGVRQYVERATVAMEQVAQFISGGEDSRVLAGILPQRLRRHAYVFLDSMNREGRIAERAAHAYGAEFRPDFRSPSHYIDILPEASHLVGGGQQYRHAHTLQFHQRHRLADYPAVFGGCFSDSLLKAPFARKGPVAGRFEFLPQFPLAGETRSEPVSHPLFSFEVLEEVTRRRREHLQRVEKMRPDSAHEWFILWPMSMRPSLSNLSSNRRLFASYEPFMSTAVVKVGAAVPISWKLNRRLFNKAFQPFLRKTRWLRHADGRLPYFPWWVNCPIHFGTWLYRWLTRQLGQSHINQGAWCDWDVLRNSPEWRRRMTEAASVDTGMSEISTAIKKGAFEENRLTVIQQVNLLQVCYLAAAAASSAVETFADADLQLINNN
jgi:hypothetical protein